jgi:tRNA threonylcarbamoyladenosine biosynthesis protein TsaB
MRVLAFDCAGASCAAAVLAEGQIVAQDTVMAERGHARLLMPVLVDLLRDAGLTFQHIDRFAVTTGPGSFTGIRVALAASRGLTLGTGKPTVGVTVFEALAAAALRTAFAAPRLLVAVESGRAECFLQLFARDGVPLADGVGLTPEAARGWAGSGPFALAGDAAWRIEPHLDAPEATGVTAVDPADIAQLAATRAPGPPPLPFYLRPPDATPSRKFARKPI